jgi:hypothetical protein
VFTPEAYADDLLPKNAERVTRIMGATTRGQIIVGGLGNCGSSHLLRREPPPTVASTWKRALLLAKRSEDNRLTTPRLLPARHDLPLSVPNHQEEPLGPT